MAVPPNRARRPGVVAGLRSRPLPLALAGALTIAFSSILVELSHTAPSTAAVFRCAYALPLLGPLAWWERRRVGPRERRHVALALGAGTFFAADLICWHHSIADSGAGLATVLGNLQVALVPVAAWIILHEHPGRRVLITLPVVMGGVLLVSGALDRSPFGANPGRGALFGVATGGAYAGFILLLRASGADLRRVAGPLFEATAMATATALLAGLVIGDAHLVPTWPAHGWLATLAVSSQVVGWLLISSSLPRLPAATTSVLLTVQPVGSMILAAVIFGDSATILQLAGVLSILAGLVAVASAGPRRQAAVLVTGVASGSPPPTGSLTELER